ncbi:hypothetical protein [Bdellovibrio sp. HCB337]|uniref:DUF7453 family protein n=1 Tax=Bdellovibrio sp. HCB337 TaxID=3394358 RepID=UPI0039A6A209
MRQIILLSTLLMLAHSAFALIPSYGKPEILVRANGHSNYNLPPMTFLSNATPAINNKGEVAFKLMAIEGKNTQGLWIKTANQNAGKIVYQAPEEKLISDPSLNDLGQAAFSVAEEGASDGIFVYDSKTGSTQHVVTNTNTDLIAHVYPTILNNGDIVFRGTHKSEDHSYFHFSQKLAALVVEGEDGLGFKPSYLFGPAINNQLQLAFKIRVGNKKDWDSQFPDQIILLNADGNFRIVACDQKTDPKSPYTGFLNSVSLSENGLVAFVAILANGKKVLVLDENGQHSILTGEGHNDIGELELFSAKVNSQGVALFRAKSSKGQRGIYLADRTRVVRLLGENDEIPSDLGKARIWSDTVYPAFAGGVNINDKNEITFHTLLVSSDSNQEWGSAIYKLSPLF